MSESTTLRDCEKLAESTVAELEAVVDGDMERCPRCGTVVNHWNWLLPGFDLLPDVEEPTEEELAEVEANFDMKCPHCRENLRQDEVFPYRFMDYVDDALAVQVIVPWCDLRPGNKEIRLAGVQIQICAGGPGIWIDTSDRCVTVSWGFEKVERYFSYETAYKIETYFDQPPFDSGAWF